MTEGFIPRGSELDIQQPDITKWNTNHFIGQAEYLGNLGWIPTECPFNAMELCE